MAIGDRPWTSRASLRGLGPQAREWNFLHNVLDTNYEQMAIMLKLPKDGPAPPGLFIDCRQSLKYNGKEFTLTYLSKTLRYNYWRDRTQTPREHFMGFGWNHAIDLSGFEAIAPHYPKELYEELRDQKKKKKKTGPPSSIP